MKNLCNNLKEKWMKFWKWSGNNISVNFVISPRKIILIVAFIVAVIYAFCLIEPSTRNRPFRDSFSNATSTTADENCTVAGINLHGTLLTYLPLHADNDPSFNYDSVSSENIISSIRTANADPKIKAVVIEVDSGGGLPVAGEEIDNAIKNSDKPVVAFIRSTGASGAYWAVSNASKIFGSKSSDIGGIGVTTSYLSGADKNIKDGYTFEQLSAGKFKDTGNADKPLSIDEKKMLMKGVNIVYENFIEAVSQNRNIPIEKVRGFATGATFLGEEAKSLGLIDQIGTIYDVENYLETKIGERPYICWDN